jgi:hypothetical protein
LTATLVWGTVRLFLARAGTDNSGSTATGKPGLDNVIEVQNAWGFGQVMSLALLILPLASLFGGLTGSPSSEPGVIANNFGF